MLINEHLFFFSLPLAAGSAIVYSQNEFHLVSLANVFFGGAIRLPACAVCIMIMALVFTKKKSGTKLFFNLNVLSQGLRGRVPWKSDY